VAKVCSKSGSKRKDPRGYLALGDVAAPIKRHLSREKNAPIEGYYEFPFFFVFE
jgi:hypothetical protein